MVEANVIIPPLSCYYLVQGKQYYQCKMKVLLLKTEVPKKDYTWDGLLQWYLTKYKFLVMILLGFIITTVEVMRSWRKNKQTKKFNHQANFSTFLFFVRQWYLTTKIKFPDRKKLNLFYVSIFVIGNGTWEENKISCLKANSFVLFLNLYFLLSPHNPCKNVLLPTRKIIISWIA